MKAPVSLLLVLAVVAQGCVSPQGQGVTALSGLNQLRIGMPQSQALSLVGKPARINQTITASGASQQYVYPRDHFMSPGQQFFAGMQAGVSGNTAPETPIYLYFQNGRLSAIQN